MALDDVEWMEEMVIEDEVEGLPVIRRLCVAYVEVSHEQIQKDRSCHTHGCPYI